MCAWPAGTGMQMKIPQLEAAKLRVPSESVSVTLHPGAYASEIVILVGVVELTR